MMTYDELSSQFDDPDFLIRFQFQLAQVAQDVLGEAPTLHSANHAERVSLARFVRDFSEDAVERFRLPFLLAVDHGSELTVDDLPDAVVKTYIEQLWDLMSI
jgi:hypothetical protein